MTMPGRPRLYLIDGYALIYRAFYALGGGAPLRNAHGENTGMAKGVNDFLKRLIEKHKPDYLGWVNDAGSSGREELLETYKANRVALPDEEQADFDTGVQRVHELLAGYRIPMVQLEGFEADDVIATLAKQGAAAGLEVCIVSGDKDLLQLVEPKVWVLNPWHGPPGRTTEKWYGMENAHERLGVPPERIVDYLALVGDTADNIPGVPGIGEKSALALVERWGSIEAMLAHVEEIEPTRARNALLKHPEEARLSKVLVTLHRDLDVTLDLQALTLETPDWATLRDLFVTLEFTTAARTAAAQLGLDEREQSPAPAIPEASASVVPADVPREYRLADTPALVAEVIAAVRAAGVMAFDTETILDADAPPIITPMRANLIGLSIAVAPGRAWYLPFAHRPYTSDQGGLALDEAPAPRANKPGAELSIAARMIAEGETPVVNLPPIRSEAMAPLRALFADPSIAKVAHHAKYDLLVMRRAGVP
ncbi:MAG: hypothetical protein RL625_732, partial [Gemmatimonadota bacterium]